MVDLNPLHYINKFNHAMGDDIASGLEFLGISDPAVDPDGVREIAKKWRHLAGGLEGASSAVETALKGVEWEGKAAKAFHKRSKDARKQATEMAHALRKGAKALDDFADKAHEMLSEIGTLLAEIAEFEIAGLALSILTAGASEVVSNLMAGERALKVVALVGRIEEEGTALGSVVRGVMEVIRGIERALKALKEIRGVTAAGKMAAEGMKFSAFTTLLEDPGAFKDPGKLAGILTEGALMGVGFGVLGKALGKGLKALGPAALAKLSKSMGLDCAAFERLKLNPGFNKLPASVRNMVKKFVRDPIDVATGDMALTRTDASLPGVLPLILQRTHLSSYRHGGWFGPTWASTLDQRVQADDEGFVYATADGARLCFPHPDPENNTPVRPATPGSRLTLSWDTETDGAVRVHDPDTGLSYVFHSPVPAAGDTAVDLPLQHIQDRNTNRITIEYTQGDIPGAVVHSGGYRIALDTNPARSRITGLRLIDPAHPNRPGTTLLTFGYDEHGHLTEEYNSSGLPLRYTYDPEGRITSWTDRNDTTYWYRYDERGRVEATGGTGGFLASTLTYDDTTRTTHVTDSLGHTRVYEHNADLRLIRETDPLGNSTVQEWDDRLQLSKVVDALGRTTRYTYDADGNLAQVLRADGHTASAEHDENGMPTQIVYADGAVWQQQYDDRGNRIAVIEPTGATTRYTYDSSGHLTSVTDALDQVRLCHCDKAGLVIEVVDPEGTSVRYQRDSFGRPTAITDQLGNTTRLDWSVEGKLVLRVNPTGEQECWHYDGEGNCTAHKNANAGTSRFEYTNFDLLAARVTPAGNRYEFSYDTELRLIRVTNPQNLIWSYQYDPASRCVRESDFDDRTHTYTHDALGQLISRTTPMRQTIRFERDALGRLTRKDSSGSITTYTYDPEGRLREAIGPDARMSFRYDDLGHIVSEATNGRTLTHAYDVLGRETSRTTPHGTKSDRVYDFAGNRTTLAISGHTVTSEHDRVGRETTRRIGNHLALSYTWDRANRLTNQSVVASGRKVQQRAYTYRPDGHLTGIEDLHQGPSRFSLDVMGQVTTVQSNDWTESYAYDDAGNLTEAEWPDAHPDPDARGGRVYAGTTVRSAGRVRYEYDGAGRMVLRQKTRLSGKPETWQFRYDAEDRLIAVTTPDRAVWRYLYDPIGRRISKHLTASDGVTIAEQVDFTWDGPTLVEQTTTSEKLPHAVTITWEHEGVSPVVQCEKVTARTDQREIDKRFFAIVTDLVGAPTELISEHGETAWRMRRTLWGTTTWDRNATAYTPLRFPGQYYDPESGLHYNHYRYYDPLIARYTTSDPLGLDPAPNPVTYVHNPHTWIDYLGLAARGPKDPLYLGQGYRGRMDTWQEGTRGTDFEIHVYDKRGREVGIFGSDGWFNKHGKSAAEADVPGSVENALKGKAVDFMRGTGRLGPKGIQDITGDKWKRPRLATEEASCKG
ncbi:DUF6531 domain-containing protein [Streptomyces sp. L2]|uniref:DUF6531 domain-containing protein n=1 Tax=Streptomyces sp. L2 TaxID=2162665 RepID=UPI00101123D8|nr:DUF6531 domain-containing protein [Streptomyces sp. L2]